MTVLVAAETVLLVLLLLLVAGLLRSHAEILRRLGALGEEEPAALPSLTVHRADPAAPEVAGLTLDGDAVGVSLAGKPTLLAFLSSGCTTCETFWSGLGEEGPGGVRVVAVTKDGSHESPARLRELTTGEVPVVLSSAAWTDFDVPGSPYFVLCEGGRVRGEGSATGWEQLGSLLRDALEDERAAGSAGPERARRADDALAAAGIAPGHPSLYPAAPPVRDP
jgi:hypothetical protein